MNLLPWAPLFPFVENEMLHRRGFSLLFLAFLFTGILSCSDNGGPTQADPDPAPEEFAVLISGPEDVTLACTGGVWTAFQVADWTGTINRFSWEVDGVSRNDGLRTTYRFDSMGTHTVVLVGFDKNSALVAADTQAVTVEAPSDLNKCLADTRILGREGVLLRTGANQVKSEYRVNIAEATLGSVDDYTWTVAIEGGEAQVIAQGVDATTVEATFTQGGQYEIGLALQSGDTTLTASLPVTVYTGAPVSEPGKIVFTNRPYFATGEGGRSDRSGIYFMDGETGHVSGPVVADGDGVYWIGSTSLACDDSRIVFAGNRTGETPDYDLWQINHDGTGLEELVDAQGLLQDADINVFGDVALIDDTRWSGDLDEIAFYSATGSFTHASGATTDTLYVGFEPSWSPEGDRLALGATRVGKSTSKVSIFQVRSLAGGTDNVLRTGKTSPQFTFITSRERVFNEGGFGVAWDPRGEYIAYTINVADTTNNESRNLIALWSLETDQVRVLDEGLGPLSWSPNGDFLLYHRLPEEGEVPGGIWQIPRGGGTPVNLSDISQVGANDELGGFCKEGG